MMESILIAGCNSIICMFNLPPTFPCSRKLENVSGAAQSGPKAMPQPANPKRISDGETNYLALTITFR
jgi:hypothetical protein